MIETYVRFARDHPAHLRLMLRPELSQPEKHPEAQVAGAGAIELLTQVVVDCQNDGVAPSGDPGPLVAMVWALAIGIVTLWLDGPLESRCVSLSTTPEELTAKITALVTGLLKTGGSRAIDVGARIE